MANLSPDQLVEQSITAYKTGDKTRASQLLAQALRRDLNNEKAWLWLSGVVATDAERSFCLRRILSINPQSDIARRGLGLLPVGLEPAPPSFPRQEGQDSNACTFPGCKESVTRAGFQFCYKHWRAISAPLAATGPLASLNATALGEKLGLSSQRTNLLLAELGWISRDRKGWVLTEHGVALGALQKEHHQTGIPFVVWPEAILAHKALLATVRGLKGESSEPAPEPAGAESNFRERFPAKFRATDGHWVRSRSEVLIDNWLYMAGVVHAYERQVPIEEEMYCDFYLPAGKLYLEFWGMENEARYLARKAAKQELYRRHGLNLVELNDEHIKNLDDVLPRLLRKYDIEVG
jgi:very-short-patch-repair endonuclease